MRQTAQMAINTIMVALIFNLTTATRASSWLFLLFQKVGAWLLLSVVGPIVIQLMTSICFVRQIANELSTLLYRSYVIIWFLLWCFPNEENNPTQTEYIFVMWNCIRIKGQASIKYNWFIPPNPQFFCWTLQSGLHSLYVEYRLWG